MFNATRLAAVAASLMLVGGAANAATTTTYLQFFQDSTEKLVAYDRGGGVTTFSAADVPVYANMLAFTPGAPYILEDLLFGFSATSTAPRNIVDDTVTQTGFAGTVSFLSGATNVLTINFDNGLSSALLGGDAKNFSTGSTSGNYDVTSDVFDLSQFLAGNFAFSISGLTNPVGVDSEYSSAGNISGTVAGAIPEPATWGMMIAGFGLVGYAARRRRSQPVAA